MTAEEQVLEEERLSDEFTVLLQDLETYLLPVTAELDAFLRYFATIIFIVFTTISIIYNTIQLVGSLVPSVLRDRTS